MVLLSHMSILLFDRQSKQAEFIIHAGGRLENYDYLNCEEGLSSYIENGYNLIELDFLFTSDQEIICSHYLEYYEDYSMTNRPTLEQAVSTPLAGKYTTLTFAKVIEKLKGDEDFKIIFDTKESDSKQIINQMIEEASEEGVNLKERMIIQVYSYENYLEMKELDFQEYWFTNYKSNYLPHQINKYFDKCEDVTTIVMNRVLWKVYRGLDFKPNKKIAVHTVNNDEYINFLQNHGVDYIYCDYR